MKKTVTVNISGIIFYIDEDAYQKLLEYIDEIKEYLTSTEGSDEIIADVEARIAEMLQQKLLDTKQVINIEDINAIITSMGAPSQFSPESDGDNSREKAYKFSSKRFYRDPDNKVIGGVCSGIAHYFNIDALWIRIAFAVALFVFGSGVLLYLFLWLITPEARTTAEKLEMRGEAVNIYNIEKSVKEELSQLNRRFKRFKKKESINKDSSRVDYYSTNIIERIFQFLYTILKLSIRFFVVVFGVVLIFVGIFLLIGFLASIIKGGHVISISSMGTANFSFSTFIQLIVGSPMQINLITIGLLLLIGIPLIMIIYNGAKMIFGFKTKYRIIGVSAFFIWLIGLTFCVYVFVKVINEMTYKALVPQKYTISQSFQKPFYVDVNLSDSIEAYMEYSSEYFNNDWFLTKVEAQKTGVGIPRLTITNSDNDSIKLIVFSEARGSSLSKAADNAKNINYNFSITDSSIVLSPIFSIKNFDKWRMQKVRILLKLPERKSFTLNKRLSYLISNDIDYNLYGKKLFMHYGNFEVEQNINE